MRRTAIELEESITTSASTTNAARKRRDDVNEQDIAPCKLDYPKSSPLLSTSSSILSTTMELHLSTTTKCPMHFIPVSLQVIFSSHSVVATNGSRSTTVDVIPRSEKDFFTWLDVSDCQSILSHTLCPVSYCCVSWASCLPSFPLRQQPWIPVKVIQVDAVCSVEFLHSQARRLIMSCGSYD